VGAIPFAAATIALLFVGWSSDRMRERRWHFAVPQFAAVGALLAWFVFPHSNALLVVVCSILGIGTIAYFPAFFALPSEFLTSAAAAAAVGFINCTASIGGYVGPKIFGELSQRTGSFNTGFVVMIACWIIGSLLVLVCPRERAPAVTS
jgi:sugar phosphate permease